MSSPFSDEQQKLLAGRLNPQFIRQFESGPQQGIRYVSGDYVILRANEIFGFGNWGYEITESPKVIESGVQGQKGTAYQVWSCRVKLTVRGCMPIEDYGTNVRSGDGANGLEMAYKGAVTDGIKRCFVAFGDQFGLELRDKHLEPDWSVVNTPGGGGATLAKDALPDAPPSRPANIDRDGVVHGNGQEMVDGSSWPNFFRAAKALNGIENMAQLKERTGDSDAHRWDAARRAAYLETLGQPVKNPPGIVPRGTPHWSESEPWGPRAFELMADMKLTEAMFSRPFGCEVTQHNFVRLVTDWLAANPTRGIEILCAMAMAPVEVAR